MGNYKNKQEFDQRVLNFQIYLKEGLNLSKAAKKAGISSWTAVNYTRKYNYECPNKGNVNKTEHNFFDIIDNELKAYLLGFFLADGTCEYNTNNMTINNAIDDISTVKLYKKYICKENKLSIRKNIGKKDTCNIGWNSNHMINLLSNKYNIKPRKTFDFSFNFPFETIPDHLIRHFIRGFFDGDGHVTKIGARIEFITTSKDFMNQIINIFEKEFNCTHKTRERQTKNVIEYMFYPNGISCKILIPLIYNWFYKDSTYFLNRKKLRFENYLNTVLSNQITKG